MKTNFNYLEYFLYKECMLCVTKEISRINNRSSAIGYKYSCFTEDLLEIFSQCIKDMNIHHFKENNVKIIEIIRRPQIVNIGKQDEHFFKEIAEMNKCFVSVDCCLFEKCHILLSFLFESNVVLVSMTLDLKQNTLEVEESNYELEKDGIFFIKWLDPVKKINKSVNIGISRNEPILKRVQWLCTEMKRSWEESCEEDSKI